LVGALKPGDDTGTWSLRRDTSPDAVDGGAGEVGLGSLRGQVSGEAFGSGLGDDAGTRPFKKARFSKFPFMRKALALALGFVFCRSVWVEYISVLLMKLAKSLLICSSISFV